MVTFRDLRQFASEQGDQFQRGLEQTGGFGGAVRDVVSAPFSQRAAQRIVTNTQAAPTGAKVAGSLVGLPQSTGRGERALAATAFIPFGGVVAGGARATRGVRAARTARAARAGGAEARVGRTAIRRAARREAAEAGVTSGPFPRAFGAPATRGSREISRSTRIARGPRASRVATGGGRPIPRSASPLARGSKARAALGSTRGRRLLKGGALVGAGAIAGAALFNPPSPGGDRDANGGGSSDRPGGGGGGGTGGGDGGGGFGESGLAGVLSFAFLDRIGEGIADFLRALGVPIGEGTGKAIAIGGTILLIAFAAKTALPAITKAAKTGSKKGSKKSAKKGGKKTGGKKRAKGR